MISRSCIVGSIALLLLVLTGCMGSAKTAIDSFDDVGDNEVLIVGRVELAPPLEKGEQKLENMIGAGMVRDKLLLLTDERWRRLADEPGRGDHHGRIEAVFDRTFFVLSKNKPFYILIGELWLDGADKVYFPAGLKINIRPADKAVYIGTLRYQRDEFFHFPRYGVIDDYEQAKAEFRKKFGNRYPLVKALAVPVKE